MRMEEIEKVARRRPFVPFEVPTANGKRHRLDHPKKFVLANRTILTVDRKRNSVIIDTLLVTAVRERPNLAKPNGREK